MNEWLTIYDYLISGEAEIVDAEEDCVCFKARVGNIRWYKNGIIHRNNGPALQWTEGTDCYYKDGFLHRENGPAIDGRAISVWYINGIKQYSRNK